jgi:hypothetical protein
MNACAERGHGFRQDSATAADVQHADPAERPVAGILAPEVFTDRRAQIAYAQAVELVQGPERTLLVPPLLR